MEKQYGTMKSLMPFTAYKMYVRDCGEGRIRYGVFNVHTRHEGMCRMNWSMESMALVVGKTLCYCNYSSWSDNRS